MNDIRTLTARGYLLKQMQGFLVAVGHAPDGDGEYHLTQTPDGTLRGNRVRGWRDIQRLTAADIEKAFDGVAS